MITKSRVVGILLVMAIFQAATVHVASADDGASATEPAETCSAKVALVAGNKVRMRWTVSCQDDDGPMGFWIDPKQPSVGALWAQTFSRVVKAAGPGAQGAGNCWRGGARVAIVCHESRKGAATFRGWIAVKRGERCSGPVVIGYDVFTANERPGLLTKGKAIFSALPEGC
jgi:hypothetical protein